MEIRVRVPPIVSVEAAVKVYYKYLELGNPQLEELFGKRSPNTFSKLKKAAWKVMQEDDMFTTNASRVNTSAAYRAWGLDIDELMKRYTRLQKIGVIPKEERPASG